MMMMMMIIITTTIIIIIIIIGLTKARLYLEKLAINHSRNILHSFQSRQFIHAFTRD
jgi:hypothetical protein